jgi:hypothetical protein
MSQILHIPKIIFGVSRTLMDNIVYIVATQLTTLDTTRMPSYYCSTSSLQKHRIEQK